MKHLCIALAIALAAAFSASAKTFDWPIGPPAAGARQFTAYHGETVRFNLLFGGAMTNIVPVAIYYQTNGMGTAEWFGPVPGTVFNPTNDCGAASYRFFIRCTDPDGVNYTANGSLRMLDSPGFIPNALPLPVSVLDFGILEVANAPYYTKKEFDETAASKRDIRDLTVYQDVTTWTWSSADADVAQDLNAYSVQPWWYGYDIGWVAEHYGDVCYNYWATDDDGEDAQELRFAFYRYADDETVYATVVRSNATVATGGHLMTTTDLSADVRREVTSQLSNVTNVRSRLLLRTDGYMEYGTGWGRLIYDFTGTRRWWEIEAPDVSASTSAASPLSAANLASRVWKTLVRTDGTNGATRCASATWRVDCIRTDDGNYVASFDVVALAGGGLTNAVFSSTATPASSITWSDSMYNYTASNFRIVSTNGASTSVSGLCDVARRYKSHYGTNADYPDITFSCAVSAPGAFAMVTVAYSDVIDTLRHHLYWDDALGVTWRIGVTNGCFFSEAVSTNNILGGWAP